MKLNPGFHSRISLIASEIFVSNNKKNERHAKFLHPISGIVVNDKQLPKCVSIEDSFKEPNILSKHNSPTKISSAISEIHDRKSASQLLRDLLYGCIPLESPGKMRYFSLLDQIFHLSLLKIRKYKHLV